jgi:hypothetical protein
MKWLANRRIETEKKGGNIFNGSEEFNKAATGEKIYITFALQIQ